MEKVFTGVPFMGTNNSPFRDKIIIDFKAKRLTYYKRSSNLIGYTLRSMKFADISSVTLYHRCNCFLFSNIIVESVGGTYDVEAKGFLPRDAREIKRIISGLNARRF